MRLATIFGLCGTCLFHVIHPSTEPSPWKKKTNPSPNCTAISQLTQGNQHNESAKNCSKATGDLIKWQWKETAAQRDVIRVHVERGKTKQ